MIGSCIQTIKGLLIQPFDTFEQLRSTTLSDAYRYYVILLVLYSALLGVASVSSVYISLYDLLIHYASIPVFGSIFAAKIELFRPLIINWSIFIVYITFVLLLFAIFLKGLFIHVFVILLGGEQGITRTVQVLMYAVTPFFLIGWIPYLSIIGLIWSVILCIIGLCILQDMPVWKAAAVVGIPTALVIIGLFSAILMVANLVSAVTRII